MRLLTKSCFFSQVPNSILIQTPYCGLGHLYRRRKLCVEQGHTSINFLLDWYIVWFPSEAADRSDSLAQLLGIPMSIDYHRRNAFKALFLMDSVNNYEFLIDLPPTDVP